MMNVQMNENTYPENCWPVIMGWAYIQCTPHKF